MERSLKGMSNIRDERVSLSFAKIISFLANEGGTRVDPFVSSFLVAFASSFVSLFRQRDSQSSILDCIFNFPQLLLLGV